MTDIWTKHAIYYKNKNIINWKIIIAHLDYVSVILIMIPLCCQELVNVMNYSVNGIDGKARTIVHCKKVLQKQYFRPLITIRNSLTNPVLKRETNRLNLSITSLVPTIKFLNWVWSRDWDNNLRNLWLHSTTAL